MAAEPVDRAPPAARWALRPFDRSWAGAVVSWVADAREQFWLAPRVSGALTAEALLAWHDARRHPYLLAGADRRCPIAYGEVNLLDGTSGEYWLGHLIVDPRHRNRGVGRRLTRLLLDAAFELHGATRVSLVVFGDNAAAVRCYLAAGMRHAGYEEHQFANPRRTERLMRFVADRGDAV